MNQTRVIGANPVAAVGIHCRAGIGRSGLVAACVLSELGTRTDALFPMLSKARRVSVPDTPEQEAWVRAFIAKRP